MASDLRPCQGDLFKPAILGARVWCPDCALHECRGGKCGGVGMALDHSVFPPPALGVWSLDRGLLEVAA